MTTFILPHAIDFVTHHNWLWYSHDGAPTDRQVVTGWQDPKSPGMRMAKHYFLTDFAHKMLPGGYSLMPMWDQQWQLEINVPGEAAWFKLTFM